MAYSGKGREVRTLPLADGHVPCWFSAWDPLRKGAGTMRLAATTFALAFGLAPAAWAHSDSIEDGERKASPQLSAYADEELGASDDVAEDTEDAAEEAQDVAEEQAEAVDDAYV